MKPVSLIGIFLGVVLLILGIASRGQGSERVLSNAVIVVASLIICFAGTFWLIALLKKDKK